MKSTILQNRALHVVAILVLLVGGLTFASCVSENGEDIEKSPIVGSWISNTTPTYYIVFDEYHQYFITNDINTNVNTEVGTYTFTNNTLTCKVKGTNTTKVYSCSVKGSNLTLTGVTGATGVQQFTSYTNTRVRR